MLGLMVVDDEFLVRIGIQQTIDWEKHGFFIVGEAENGEDGLELAKRLQPDIIITDIRMPNMDGLEFMAKLKENGIEAKVIVLSGYDEFDYARAALNHGALAYLLKPIENQQLLDVVQNTGQKIIKERELKQYYHRLEQELPMVKKHQLVKMIDGAAVSLDVHDLEKIDFPLHAKKILIVVKVDDFDLFARKFTDKIEHFQGSFLVLGDKLFHHHKPVILEKAINEWIIILEEDDNTTLVDVYDYCQDVLQSLYNYNCFTRNDLTFSVGISHSFADITEISTAYQEAMRAADFKLIPGSCNITHVDEAFPTGVQAYIQQAIVYIKNNYQNDITIEDVADSLSLSTSYLMHLFKSKLGKTFGECLVDFRVSAAKELLRDPGCKVYEVSEKVGYKDPKYFSQIFKRSTGFTPKDFAQLMVDNPR